MNRDKNNIKIFLDVDGVLSDFMKHYFYIKNIEYNYNNLLELHKKGYLRDIVSSWELWGTMSDGFYRNMPKTREADFVVKMLTPDWRPWNITFLTAAMHRKELRIGWCKKRWPLVPVIVDEEKWKYCSGKKSILIDDFIYNLEMWKRFNGSTIRFNRFWNERDENKVLNYFPKIFIKRFLKSLSSLIDDQTYKRIEEHVESVGDEYLKLNSPR